MRSAGRVGSRGAEELDPPLSAKGVQGRLIGEAVPHCARKLREERHGIEGWCHLHEGNDGELVGRERWIGWAGRR